jgi:hypothetical protein
VIPVESDRRASPSKGFNTEKPGLTLKWAHAILTDILHAAHEERSACRSASCGRAKRNGSVASVPGTGSELRDRMIVSRIVGTEILNCQSEAEAVRTSAARSAPRYGKNDLPPSDKRRKDVIRRWEGATKQDMPPATSQETRPCPW